MSLTHVQCPNGTLAPVDICLSYCQHPCATLPTRRLLTKEREWKGKASTTQLLNGTMLEFLKITNSYSIDLQDRVFILLGINTHGVLEESAKQLNIPAEIALSEDRDIFDLLEPCQDGFVLSDYKVWGSYKVAKALGVIPSGKKPDPSGELYKSSGKWGKAGTPKMIDTFEIHPEKGEMWETELQLNRYRVMLSDRNVKIIKMQLQIMVRDFSTRIGDRRGLEQGMYLTDVRVIPDVDVRRYFAEKEEALALALKQGHWEHTCTERECWDGVRCKGYCDVASLCPRGIMYEGEKK